MTIIVVKIVKSCENNTYLHFKSSQLLFFFIIFIFILFLLYLYLF